MNKPSHDTLLDNPIWDSLSTGHAGIAVVSAGGLARRYPASIGPLAGLRDTTPEAYAELASITPDGDIAILFLDEKPEVPAGWELLRDGALVQMVCQTIPEEPHSSDPQMRMQPVDFAEMLALAKLTEPGPFREQTAELGGFLGIRVDGRLAAMAGQRTSPDGYTEISAVCTHPDFRGRGYAKALVAAVAREIFAAGKVPFLTSFAANAGAIKVYEQVGFVTRRRFELAVLRPPAGAV